MVTVLFLGTYMRPSLGADTTSAMRVKYEANWQSLSQWEVPQWFEDAVLGIYCHWGVYSVPGFRFNDGSEQVDSGLWYGWFMYVPNGEEQPNFGVYDYHRRTYGPPCEWGYHEFVPMFKAERWDPDRWAQLYKYAGADFAGVSRMQYPPLVRIIRSMCSGRISEEFVLHAFRRGVAAVLVAGCHLNDCHYIDANYQTKKRVERLWKKLEKMGIETERLQLAWISAAEGEKFASKIKEMKEIVDKVSKQEIKKTVEVLEETA